jgi:hypothetical protein
MPGWRGAESSLMASADVVTTPRPFFTMEEVIAESPTTVAQLKALIRRGDLRAIQIGGPGIVSDRAHRSDVW